MSRSISLGSNFVSPPEYVRPERWEMLVWRNRTSVILAFSVIGSLGYRP